MLNGKELKNEVIGILKKYRYLEEKDGYFIHQFYADYNDSLREETIKSILEKETVEDRKDKLSDVLFDIYYFAIFDAMESYKNMVINELKEKGIEFNEDCVDDCVRELISCEYPTSHYLNTKVYANLLLDVGDANYDFSVNDLRNINREDGISEESAILWVAKQQGYTKEQLESAVFDGEYNGSKFLKSMSCEVENGHYMNAFTFLFKTTIGELIGFNKESIEGIKISKDTNCGLVDFWYGAGGPIEVELEKDIIVPSNYIDSFTIDGGRGTYSIDSIYGPTREIWNGKYEILLKKS